MMQVKSRVWLRNDFSGKDVRNRCQETVNFASVTREFEAHYLERWSRSRSAGEYLSFGAPRLCLGIQNKLEIWPAT